MAVALVAAGVLSLAAGAVIDRPPADGGSPMDLDTHVAPPALETGEPPTSAASYGPPAGAPQIAPTPPATLLPPLPRGSVPVLYYHRVEAPPIAFSTWSRDRQRSFLAYDVIPAALRAQLDWLALNGYTTILPRDLAAHWDSGSKLPARPVILTFDDGFRDWATTVLPMLEARHMVAEFYLTLEAIRSGAVTWREVRTLAAAGNGIGAHDVHHVQLAGLGPGRPTASEAVMWAEVTGARRAIAEHIGIAPDSMAYVGGGFNPVLERLVAKAGYTSARSIRRGIIQTSANRFELRVVRVGVKDDVMDVVAGTIAFGLPTFTARMHGINDDQ